ncbi:MAG: transposase [Proteobacteria bacterium]|nr:transposase [Pseudomonadota bacterium]
MAPRLAPCWRRLTTCRNGRAFAAYLGLVPRQHASGEKSAMRGITKHGQGEAAPHSGSGRPDPADPRREGRQSRPTPRPAAPVGARSGGAQAP